MFVAFLNVYLFKREDSNEQSEYPAMATLLTVPIRWGDEIIGADVEHETCLPFPLASRTAIIKPPDNVGVKRFLDVFVDLESQKQRWIFPFTASTSSGAKELVFVARTL